MTDQTYLRKNLNEFQEGFTNANMFSYSSISLCIEPTSHALDRLHLPYSFCPERIAQVKYRLPMIEESFEVEEEVSLHPLIQWLVSSEIYIYWKNKRETSDLGPIYNPILNWVSILYFSSIGSQSHLVSSIWSIHHKNKPNIV